MRIFSLRVPVESHVHFQYFFLPLVYTSDNQREQKHKIFFSYRD